MSQNLPADILTLIKMRPRSEYQLTVAFKHVHRDQVIAAINTLASAGQIELVVFPDQGPMFQAT